MFHVELLFRRCRLATKIPHEIGKKLDSLPEELVLLPRRVDLRQGVIDDLEGLLRGFQGVSSTMVAPWRGLAGANGAEASISLAYNRSW